MISMFEKYIFMQSIHALHNFRDLGLHVHMSLLSVLCYQLLTEAPNDTWPGCSFFLSNWDFYSLCLPANGRAANISSQHQLIVWNFILQKWVDEKRCQDGVSGAKPLPIRWIVINSQPVGRHAERLAQSSPVVLVVSFCSMSDRFVCRQFKSFSFLTQKHTQARTHTHTHKSELINCTGDRELIFFWMPGTKSSPSTGHSEFGTAGGVGMQKRWWKAKVTQSAKCFKM